MKYLLYHRVDSCCCYNICSSSSSSSCSSSCCCCWCVTEMGSWSPIVNHLLYSGVGNSNLVVVVIVVVLL